MASNVIALHTRRANAVAMPAQATPARPVAVAVGASVHSFAQARTMRDLPRHLKAGAL